MTASQPHGVDEAHRVGLPEMQDPHHHQASRERSGSHLSRECGADHISETKQRKRRTQLTNQLEANDYPIFIKAYKVDITQYVYVVVRDARQGEALWYDTPEGAEFWANGQPWRVEWPEGSGGIARKVLPPTLAEEYPEWAKLVADLRATSNKLNHTRSPWQQDVPQERLDADIEALEILAGERS